MSLGANKVIELAVLEDVSDILNLYRLVYGKKYPIQYGTDTDLLKSAIVDEESHMVLVARAKDRKVITGALIIEIDAFNKIGKLVGLVVHPDFQKNKIGNELVVYASEFFLEKDQRLNSLYATTRTVTVGPQRVFIRNHFLPLGIFPNAHRLHKFETVTLFAKFRKGLLEKRPANKEVSQSLMPLYNIVKDLVPSLDIPKIKTPNKVSKFVGEKAEADWEFEIIRAPSYVYRKFLKTFPDPIDSFFPFHSPNMLIADKKGRIEIFAYFNKRDGYCTLIKATRPISELLGGLTSLYMQLDDIGVSYLEVMVNADLTSFIETLLAGQFIPSAIYPAMREMDGKYEDFVILSRTMEPLNFRGMAVISQFRPYIDQYLEAWKQVNLDTIEVIYDTK